MSLSAAALAAMAACTSPPASVEGDLGSGVTVTLPAPTGRDSGGLNGEQLGALGSRLRPVEGQTPVERSSICSALGPDQCAAVGADPSDLHWRVTLGADGGRTLSVYAPVEPASSANDGLMAEVFRAVEDGPEWAELIVADTDVSGDQRSDLVVGFRAGGSAALLQVDLVESAGAVLATRIFEKGRLRVGADGISAWGARFAPDDANCCPSSYVQETIGWSDGRWVVLGSLEVDPDEVEGS